MTKAIVNGTIFDTDTTVRLGEIESGSRTFVGDFDDWHVTLYRPPKGGFFMKGDGRALSPFAQSTGGSWWQGSEGVAALELEQALSHAEGTPDADIILKHFAELLNEA